MKCKWCCRRLVDLGKRRHSMPGMDVFWFEITVGPLTTGLGVPRSPDGRSGETNRKDAAPQGDIPQPAAALDRGLRSPDRTRHKSHVAQPFLPGLAPSYLPSRCEAGLQQSDRAYRWRLPSSGTVPPMLEPPFHSQADCSEGRWKIPV